MERPSDRPVILDASASRVTFEQIAAFPPPGWQIPRHAQRSPDGKLVTYLQSESGGEEMALWALDVQTKQHAVLLRAADLIDTGKPMSREEELRRERQRKRIAGVTAYEWAAEAPVMLLPLGGNVYVRGADGKISQLTDSDAPEIDPRICADGSKVAYARGRELYVIDVASKKETALTRGAEEGVTRGQSDFNGQEEFAEPHGFWWSPRCDRIAYLEVDEREVAQLPIMGYRNGPDLQHLRYPRAGTKNPKSRLGVVDVESGAQRWIAMPDRPAWDPDDQYLGRVQWSRDGKTLYVQRLSRNQQHLALVAADPASGRAEHLVEERDDAWTDFAGMRPLDGGDWLWLTWRDGHRHLERRDPKGQLVARLTSGDWDVFEIAGVDAARVLFIANRDATLDRQLYAIALDGSAPMVRLSQEPGVHEVEAPRPEHGWVDIHSAADRLPRAVVHAADGSVAGEIEVPSDPAFDGLALRTPETVEIPGDPTLYGALLEPRNKQPGVRYPLIVMVYGGPGVQSNLNSYNPRLLWQHLADRGFAVWQVDNRGSVGRGHAFETPIHQNMGKVELADQLRGLDAVLARDFVDPERVGIYGHSYGGYMTILAMLRAADRFKVGVSGSPVTHWKYYDTGYTERYMGTPQQNAADYDASAVLADVGKLKGKLLVIHAFMDENVHFEHSAALIDGLVAADKDFDLLVFPGERHGYRSPVARKYAYRRVVDYFVEHL